MCELGHFDGLISFLVVIAGKGVRSQFGVKRPELRQHVAVKRFVRRPCGELRFEGPFLVERAQAGQPLAFALPFFPLVRYPRIFSGVGDAGCRILGLLGIHDLEAHRAHFDFGRVAAVDRIVDRVRNDVLHRASRIAVDHREISLFEPCGRNLERTARTVGDVVFGIVRRVVVFVGIDAKHRKVAGMAGPHPVVGIAAEFTDCRGRGGHEPYVAELFINEQEVLVPVIERFDGSFVMRACGGFCNHACGVGLDHRIAFGLRHFIADPFQCTVGHIFHADQERHGQPRIRQLFGAVHRPEAVGQVVVLHAAVRTDEVVSAVVVREEKALVGDHLAGATASEEQDCVLER